jgi:hypothetical protein
MFATGFAMLFMVALGGLAARGMLPTVIPVFYATASIAAAIAYRLNKSAAERNVGRISETMLHVIAADRWLAGCACRATSVSTQVTETVIERSARQRADDP